MKGKYHIVVQNNKLRYELNIRRNITIIRGDSATGKSKLIHLLDQASALGESSGVEVYCERPCRTLGGNDWNLILPNIHEQIIFLDEEHKFVKTQEFAAAVKASDNYFVIVTREDFCPAGLIMSHQNRLHIKFCPCVRFKMITQTQKRHNFCRQFIKSHLFFKYNPAYYRPIQLEKPKEAFFCPYS